MSVIDQRTKLSINCKGKLIDLSQPRVMGVLNLTPDSFFEGSRSSNISEALIRCNDMLAHGATFIDIGGYSSRPGAQDITIQEEQDRVLPILQALVAEYAEGLFSIDTFRHEVAEEALKTGVAIVNDISGGLLDPKMDAVLSKWKAPYVLMHMQGSPQTMQENPQYEDVVKEVFQFFDRRINELKDAGLHDIVIDPGFGFGKTQEHNFTLLNQLSDFNQLGHPLLIGVSRKGMIYKTLGTGPEEALNGTTAINTLALDRGANILRVHDVKAAQEAIQLFKEMKSQDK